jgi:zinc-ribbon domain
MAQYCASCGSDLRDGDRFCAACGASVGLSASPSETTTPSQATTYETCEIKWRLARRWPIYKMVFYAEAIGPQGMYNAGESKGVSNISSPVGGFMNAHQTKTAPALTAFIAQLTSQGWESVPEKGPAWYSYKFRRPVRS